MSVKLGLPQGRIKCPTFHSTRTGAIKPRQPVNSDVRDHKTVSHIQSFLLKKCPYCGEVINIRLLRKIPCSAPLRWYQFTPGAQAACPECGGHVKSTAESSKILLIGFGVLIAIALAGALFPVARNWVALLPGGLYLLALSALVLAWHVLKNSELVRANDDR